MLAIPSRHRSLVLLAVVVAAQVLLLAAQIKRAHHMRLIRIWTVELFTPLQRVGSFAVDRLHTAWINYIALRHLREENEQLRSEVQQLRLHTSELEGRAAEADRLAVLLGFHQAHAEMRLLPARVISASPVATSRTVYINRGEKEGVRKNMPVITPDGVVGKILEAYPDTAQVLLLTDRESGVGALLADLRTKGVVKGTGAPEPLMEYVINDENVSAGERILTSGMDRIFPKDLPVGTVASTQPGYPFKVIHVKPAAHLDRLEEVFVLLGQQPLAPARETESVTAKDSAAKDSAKEPAPPE